MTASILLERLAKDFATAVPSIDLEAEHDRWQAGIGPFEEANQIGYWYDFEVETRAVAHFDGLRHPVHQQGAVIAWEIIE